MAYTTWQQVVDLYPRAADVESNSTNQTALITAKQALFSSFIRNVHKRALVEPVDEVVNLAVAYLVIDELKKRRLADDSDLEFQSFDHIRGLFTDAGLWAHSLIEGIRKGAIVLGEDDAERDKFYPDAVEIAKTGTGTIRAYMPYGYRGTAIDVYTVKIVTTGRVEDETAAFDVYLNSADDDPLVSGETCGAGWYDLGNGVYVSFADAATTGNSFVAGDEWTIRAIPETGEGRSSGPAQFDMYSG